jgi:hypothetical protein
MWTTITTAEYIIEGQRIKRWWAARGVALDQSQVQALAHASLGPPKRWIASEPELSPEAQQILDNWTRSLALDQHELDHTHRQPHDHGRLREEGVDLNLDHDRIQLMGLDQTAPGQSTAQGGVSNRPKDREVPAPSGVDRGRGRYGCTRTPAELRGD